MPLARTRVTVMTFPWPENRGHVPQPLGIAGGLAGGVQSVGHHSAGEGGAVGEGDTLPQGEGPGEAVGAVSLAAQHRHGLKGLVQLKQGLVQQGGQGQVRAICPQNGVKGIRGIGRQGETGGGRGRLRVGDAAEEETEEPPLPEEEAEPSPLGPQAVSRTATRARQRRERRCFIVIP